MELFALYFTIIILHWAFYWILNYMDIEERKS